MQTLVEVKKIAAITYPCLMITKTGAIVMYVTDSQGTVLHTTEESNWKVGDEVRSDIKHMRVFESTLRLSN